MDVEKDLTGKVFGWWTVLKFDKIKHRYKYWICRCKCGAEFSICGSALVCDRTSKCKKCSNIEKGKKNRKSDEHIAITGLIKVYKRSAKVRGLSFNLSREEFKSLIFENCHYCGQLPSNIYNSYPRDNEHNRSPIMYNGIDRVNNTKGYDLDNCVTSCTQCNFSKRTLNKEQFLTWIKRIYINQYKKVTDKTPGELCDLLFTTNMKCWWAQERIMDKSLSSEEKAKAAEQAQEYNARRNKLIRSIDAVLDFSEDTPTSKTYHTYFEEKK